MRVTTTEFIAGYGALADRALTEPVTIITDGHDHLVLISAEEYARLRGRDRRVVRPESMNEAELALVAAAEVPAEHAHLDAELSDPQHP